VVPGLKPSEYLKWLQEIERKEGKYKAMVLATEIIESIAMSFWALQKLGIMHDSIKGRQSHHPKGTTTGNLSGLRARLLAH